MFCIGGVYAIYEIFMLIMHIRPPTLKKCFLIVKQIC